jgi:hypothetical protein
MAGFFDGTRPGHSVSHGSASFDLPIVYLRDDCFGLFFTASAERLRESLPSDRLHPVLVSRRRALLAIVAFHYIDTSVGPYGEVAVVAPVVHGSGRPSPILPALLESRWPGFGMLVLHLPVTTSLARDAGRGQWGYTKFVADMRFELTPEALECRLSEGEQHVLSLRVQRGGLFVRDRKPLVTYSVLDGRLIRTQIPQRGAYRARLAGSGSRLELGEHPVADELRALELSRPLLTRYYVERAAILPEGQAVETGVRPLEGWKGEDREGRLEQGYGLGPWPGAAPPETVPRAGG